MKKEKELTYSKDVSSVEELEKVFKVARKDLLELLEFNPYTNEVAVQPSVKVYLKLERPSWSEKTEKTGKSKK